MRRFKYVIFFVAAVFGLYLGDTFGPAGDLAFDWDMMIPFGLSKYVYYHHYLILGVTVSLFTLIVSRFFEPAIWPIVGVSMLVGFLRFSLDLLRGGEPRVFAESWWILEYFLPFSLGVLTVFGLWFLIAEALGIESGKPNT